MKSLQTKQLGLISGGCGGDSCKVSTLHFLENCSNEQMVLINQIFMDVILSPGMLNADDDTIKAALISAIESATI